MFFVRFNARETQEKTFVNGKSLYTRSKRSIADSLEIKKYKNRVIQLTISYLKNFSKI
jgi:hypothetical protein